MLQAEGVAAFRGERLVFSGLSFSLRPGDATLLMGPNGAGKSTLLRLLAGLVRLAAGCVLWNGEDAFADLAAHARRLAYAGHLDAVKPGLTVAENLGFAARVANECRRSLLRGSGIDPSRKGPSAPLSIHKALDVFGLVDRADLPAGMLSAGQRRRLALARVILSPAPLWLLDEPTTGLDADLLDRAAAVFASHRGDGGMIVAATHVALPLPDAVELHLG